ncbi:uncharacterized protein A4U43_C05F3080 [Asparagus officinalis]|uniref:Legume lectin domain-containing protein n=1 Tax=Asparagus officinalis TaxID=4686 RepID=A0A5P1EPZ3_ASPOF|nr:uncharacterized protein A4U43_C05F3080 [Asparagus officinalis]
MILLDWVWEKWVAGKWAEVLDPNLGGGFDMEEAEVAVKVGLLCSHPIGVIRPSMREVVRYLDGGDAVEVPEVRLPPGEYEGVVRSSLGFEDFVHSYPSSSFEKEGEKMDGGAVTGASSVGPYSYSPLSLFSRGSV